MYALCLLPCRVCTEKFVLTYNHSLRHYVDTNTSMSQIGGTYQWRQGTLNLNEASDATI